MSLRRACLAVVVLAFALLLGHTAARADGLDDALTHFTAGDYDETNAGIAAVAGSGSPRAEAILRALEGGQLMFSAEHKAVYIQDDASKLTDAATDVGSYWLTAWINAGRPQLPPQ